MSTEGDHFEPELLENLNVGGTTQNSTAGSLHEFGHFFTKKNFGKTYCHNCCEVLWGIISQGFICEVCNFACHEKCLKTVASYCSGVAMQLIKNPVAHCWSDPSKVKNKFCCVCRKRTDDSQTVECEVCEYYVHVDCSDLAVSDCKEAATYVPNVEAISVHHHHWREGNLPQSSKCVNCRKTCCSGECLAGVRCEWCGITAHAVCYKQLPQACEFGPLRRIVLPPYCVTIPRTELPMEQLLSIKRKDKESSSPIKGDDASFSAHTPDEMGKEKEDQENVKVYDGNTSLLKNNYRTCLVTKHTTTQQITEMALRTFHIRNPTANYFVSQMIPEDGTEELLDESQPPLKIAQRRVDGKRVQLFLRLRDSAQDKTTLKVYGGWLRIPVTFCTLVLDHDTTVETVVKDSLARFGLNSANSDLFNLVEVSLDRGVVERTLDSSEGMLAVVNGVKNDSLKRFQLTRYYLQEKEDPHGSNVSVFVGNLPPSLAQRKYERILLRLLGAEVRPFTAIGPIYYEYGSLIITFNSPKSATKACLKLQRAAYEDKKLLVLCLPNIQPQMVPCDVEPLMVLINVKSGGCQGLELIRSFRKLLNPFQVFDILNGGPLVGLFVFRNIPKYRILVCGGDGTVGWVLQCLDIVGQDSVCSSPPCGIVPLGTGNDLARVLRWGKGYTGQEDPLQILKDVCDAEEIKLDRWTVVFHTQEPSEMPVASSEQNPDDAMQMNNPEDQTSMIIMNNYFGIGVDADVALEFHKEREENPEKFTNRLLNKGKYATIGLKKMMNKKACKDLHKKIRVEVDSKLIELNAIEGIIILNISSWGSGAKPWGLEKEDGAFVKPTHYDGLLEVVGITGLVHLGQITSGFSSGLRIAQGGHATMLKKPKSKRRYTDPQIVHRPPSLISEPSSAGHSQSHSPHAYMQPEPDDEFL